MLHDLMEAALYLALIATFAAGLLYVAGRDPKAANEHDLSDYHELAPDNDPTCRYVVADGKVSLKAWATASRPEVLGPRMTVTERDILPPAPPGMNAGSPLYAGMLFDTWHPEDADVVAARWLREIAAEQQDKAGIRPPYDPDRDMTGAFPVVAVA